MQQWQQKTTTTKFQQKLQKPYLQFYLATKITTIVATLKLKKQNYNKKDYNKNTGNIATINTTTTAPTFVAKSTARWKFDLRKQYVTTQKQQS